MVFPGRVVAIKYYYYRLSMQGPKPTEVSRVNLNFAMPRQPLLLKNDCEAKITKRLQYCLHRKLNRMKSERERATELHFNDSSYFNWANGNAGGRKESNLLQKGKDSPMGSPGRVNRRTNSVNIINIEAIQVPDPNEPMSYCPSSKNASFVERQRRPGSPTSLEKMEGRKMTRAALGKKSKAINPYTREEYLHLRPKDKQDSKRSVEFRKLYQMQQNILKPCRIAQKELNSREMTLKTTLTSVGSRPVTARAPLERAATAKAREDNFIQPWESRPSNLNEDIFD